MIRPVYVDQVWGNAFDLGLLIAVNAAGAILGAAVYGVIGQRLPRHATFVTMFMLTGLRFWIMALYPSLIVVLIATFLSSLGAGPLNPILDAVEYERIPPHMCGRVFGVIYLITTLSMAFVPDRHQMNRRADVTPLNLS